ncbi:MAG: NUDIX domain-containing protein [Candidatus Micrarchaeia archaeon]
MTELLETYDLKGKFLGVVERKKFYQEIKQEFKETGRITRKVKTIRALLLNSNGRIYLQKRSKFKDANAGKYDKTVGGHVMQDDSFELTLTRECAEELGFPATIVSEKEFEKATKNTNLSIVAIFKKIDNIQNFESKRTIVNGTIIQPYITNIYLGYYEGPLQFMDGESSGIEVFSLDELKQEIREHPDKFTEDLKFMVKKYEKYLKPIK